MTGFDYGAADPTISRVMCRRRRKFRQSLPGDAAGRGCGGRCLSSSAGYDVGDGDGGDDDDDDFSESSSVKSRCDDSSCLHCRPDEKRQEQDGELIRHH